MASYCLIVTDVALKLQLGRALFVKKTVTKIGMPPLPLVMHIWGVAVVPVTTFEGKSSPVLSLATKSSYLDVLPM